MGARSTEGAKSEAILQPEPAPTDDALAAYCPDIDQWPRSWMYDERDLPPGQQMVECFKPFLRHLVRVGLSRKTLGQHRATCGSSAASSSWTCMRPRG